MKHRILWSDIVSEAELQGVMEKTGYSRDALIKGLTRTAAKIETLNPWARGAVATQIHDLYVDHGLPVAIYSGHRSDAEQAAYKARGQSPAGPGGSYHAHGVAYDLLMLTPSGGMQENCIDPNSKQAWKRGVVRNNSNVQTMRAAARAIGLTWGGSGDDPHYQMVPHGGKTSLGALRRLPKDAEGYCDLSSVADKIPPQVLQASLEWQKKFDARCGGTSSCTLQIDNALRGSRGYVASIPASRVAEFPVQDSLAAATRPPVQPFRIASLEPIVLTPPATSVRAPVKPIIPLTPIVLTTAPVVPRAVGQSGSTVSPKSDNSWSAGAELAFEMTLSKTVEIESSNPPHIKLGFDKNGEIIWTGWERQKPKNSKGKESTIIQAGPNSVGVYWDAGNSITNDFGRNKRVAGLTPDQVLAEARKLAVSPEEMVNTRRKTFKNLGYGKLPPEILPQMMLFYVHQSAMPPYVLANAVGVSQNHPGRSLDQSVINAAWEFHNKYGASALIKAFEKAQIAYYEGRARTHGGAYAEFLEGFCNRAKKSAACGMEVLQEQAALGRELGERVVAESPSSTGDARPPRPAPQAATPIQAGVMGAAPAVTDQPRTVQPRVIPTPVSNPVPPVQTASVEVRPPQQPVQQPVQQPSAVEPRPVVTPAPQTNAVAGDDQDDEVAELNRMSLRLASAGGVGTVSAELTNKGVTLSEKPTMAEIIHQAYEHRLELKTSLTGDGRGDPGTIDRGLFRILREQYGDLLGAADLNHNGAIDRSDMAAIRQQLQSKGVSYGDGASTLTSYLSMLQQQPRTRD